MTPIEKNIIVVDEQGNEYEATYPKRAKGLVKNGRARFITQNKICLLCPPKIEMEDNKMSENINVNENVEVNPEVVLNKANENKVSINAVSDRLLTVREIFEKIVELQKQLTESSYHSLHRLDDSISSICADENEEKSQQITEVCSVFKMRETTLLKMLELYEKMYDDLKSSEIQKTTRSGIADEMTKIIKSQSSNTEVRQNAVDVLKAYMSNY